MDKLITIKDTATILGLHERTVRRMIERNELKAYKIGRCVRLKESEIQDYVDGGIIIRTPSVVTAKFSYKPGDKLVY